MFRARRLAEQESPPLAALGMGPGRPSTWVAGIVGLLAVQGQAVVLQRFDSLNKRNTQAQQEARRQ